MKADILEFTEGAESATGYTVIIDVLRAFSVACYLFDKGICNLKVVEHVEQAFHLKDQEPDLVLVGERNERKVPGFHYGNSPSEIAHASLTGKNVVLTTSAGTLGLARSVHAGTVVTGSFVNALAIANHIKKVKPERVSLVAMGFRAVSTADEDLLCARYIKNTLENVRSDFPAMKETIRRGTGRRFFDPANSGHSPPEDFELCMDLNRFPFVLQATRLDDHFAINIIDS